MAPTRPNLVQQGPTWPQIGSKIDHLRFNLSQFGSILAVPISSNMAQVASQLVKLGTNLLIVLLILDHLVALFSNLDEDEEFHFVNNCYNSKDIIFMRSYAHCQLVPFERHYFHEKLTHTVLKGVPFGRSCKAMFTMLLILEKGHQAHCPECSQQYHTGIVL